MAKKPTHYKLKLKRSVEVANARLNPGARFTVKAAILDQIKAMDADAIDTAEPLILG